MKFLGIFVFALFLAAGLGLAFAFPIMWALNYVFTSSTLIALFGVAKIGFWRAYVLSLLTAMLFKSQSTK